MTPPNEPQARETEPVPASEGRRADFFVSTLQTSGPSENAGGSGPSGSRGAEGAPQARPAPGDQRGPSSSSLDLGTICDGTQEGIQSDA